MAKQLIRKAHVSARLLWFPTLLAFVLCIFALALRERSSPMLPLSILGAAAALLAYAAVLRQRVIAAGRTLTLEFVPRTAHWVQLIMHSCIYAYWGWYWRQVYDEIPLIIAQILFVYALDMLTCWSRRDKWLLGFGPIPIILSTNLFLWFRDDWFFLQFVMISIGVIGKEYVQWKREGRSTHIFNPSAVGLFLFSVILIATHGTQITWGEEIALNLHLPPNIYFEIFLLGLVVQALFSVTLVTLAAASVLVLANLIYTRVTGVYMFIDSNIPVSVFIGLHLLVTDPATSPRSKSGKIVFGGLYGASVFGLYALLTTMGAPRFYDKLLPVPPLNLLVRVLDKVGYRLDQSLAKLFQSIRAPRLVWSASPQQMNMAFMSIWVVLFGWMMSTGFVTTQIVGIQHPGKDPAFWQQACDAHRYKACTVWVGVLNTECENGSASACLSMGTVTNLGVQVPREPEAAGRGLGRACDLGAPKACGLFIDFVKDSGDRDLQAACDKEDAFSCFYLATALHAGKGVGQDDTRALSLFQSSCKKGYVRGCGVAGEMYLNGQGAATDTAKALTNLEKSCAGGWAESCVEAATVYHHEAGGPAIEELAGQRLLQGCNLGDQAACRMLMNPALLDSPQQ